jgi:hypothetical protein
MRSDRTGIDAWPARHLSPADGRAQWLIRLAAGLISFTPGILGKRSTAL